MSINAILIKGNISFEVGPSLLFAIGRENTQVIDTYSWKYHID